MVGRYMRAAFPKIPSSEALLAPRDRAEHSRRNAAPLLHRRRACCEIRHSFKRLANLKRPNEAVVSQNSGHKHRAQSESYARN